MVTKTKFEGVFSTKDFVIEDRFTVSEVTDSLLYDSIDENDKSMFVFNKFDNPGWWYFGVGFHSG